MVSTGGFIKTSTATTWNFGKWLWKNKFIILILFAYIPLLITSIHVAQENNYPIGVYVPIQAGVSLVNADSQLYEKVYLLETDPNQIIGMDKPEKGIYQKTKYFFKVFRVVWLLLGLVSLITLPFFFFFWVYNHGNTSTKWKSLWKAIWTTLIIITFINMLIIIITLLRGSSIYSLDNSLNFFKQALYIIKLVLPFHGIVELFKYIISIIV